MTKFVSLLTPTTMLILIIEDDVHMSELIGRGLSEAGYSITTANDGIDGLVKFSTKKPDLVITDIMLPGLNGLEICKRIKEINDFMPVIMLTALGTTNEKVEGFDVGADDYMVKPFEMRELMARIKALLKRSKNTNIQCIIKVSNLELNTKTKVVKRGDREIRLTPKEFNLLEFLMKNKNRVVSKSEIAEKVWDTHFDTGTNFIDVYISYLRHKIDMDFAEKLIVTKPGMGFILKDSTNEDSN